MSKKHFRFNPRREVLCDRFIFFKFYNMKIYFDLILTVNIVWYLTTGGKHSPFYIFLKIILFSNYS